VRGKQRRLHGGRARRTLIFAAIISLVVSACTAASEEAPSSSITTTLRTPTTTTRPGSTTVSTPRTTTTLPSTDPNAAPDPSGGAKSSTCQSPTETAVPEGPTSQTIVLRDDPDGLRIEAAVYPRPGYEGNPWSQWGQGLVLPDGRFVSAIGDHLGVGGNSYVYEYTPTAGRLTMVADMLSLAGLSPDQGGYGKIHAQLVAGGCDEVFIATYWGSRNRLEYSDAYRGDFVARWNTASHDLVILDVPVPGHGLPSLAGAQDGTVLYGEAVDPTRNGKNGQFFAYDTRTGESTVVGGPHKGFRSVLVDAAGRAYFSAGDGVLRMYDAATREVIDHPDTLPGDWLRASTQPATDGTVYGVTRQPDVFFAMSPDGAIREIGPAVDYTTTLALTPDERELLYVPAAHGRAWEYGTPLLAVDVETGAERVVAELNGMAERELGLTLGGTYDLAFDRVRNRVFIGFNAGPSREDPWGEVVLFVIQLGPESERAASLTEDSNVVTTSPGCWSAPTSGRSGALALVESASDLGALAPLIGLRGHAAGAADVNGDGWVDLVVGTFADRPSEQYKQRGADGPRPDQLLLGGPDGFQPASLPVSLSRTSGVAFADLDGDGDLDMILARNVRRDAEEGTVVLENSGGSFSVAAILNASAGARSIGILDYDGDGRLDVFLVEDRWSGGSSVLYRNRGAFRFADTTGEAGLPKDIHGLGVGVGDLNGDSHQDLVVGGSNRIFIGNGEGRLRESSQSPFVWELYGDEDDPAGVAIADIDNDGAMDLVIGQHFNSTVDDGRGVPIRLYLNRGNDGAGDPRFEDVTKAASLVGLPTKGPHIEVADLDNDGWPDIVTTASAEGGTKPAIFLNKGVRDGIPRFEAPPGLGSDQYWISGAVADMDRDGRLDIVAVEWEPALPTRLYLNRTEAGHWLGVELVGTDEPTIGAIVTVYEAGYLGDARRLLGLRHVQASTGYGGGTGSSVHFGLGGVGGVDLRVEFPSGRTVDLPDVTADQQLRVGTDCSG